MLEVNACDWYKEAHKHGAPHLNEAFSYCWVCRIFDFDIQRNIVVMPIHWTWERERERLWNSFNQTTDLKTFFTIHQLNNSSPSSSLITRASFTLHLTSKKCMLFINLQYAYSIMTRPSTRDLNIPSKSASSPSFLHLWDFKIANFACPTRKLPSVHCTFHSFL